MWNPWQHPPPPKPTRKSGKAENGRKKGKKTVACQQHLLRTAERPCTPLPHPTPSAPQPPLGDFGA